MCENTDSRKKVRHNMKAILVDDERWALEQLQAELEQAEDIEIVGVFSEAEEAMNYTQEHPVDLALLDVRMPGMDGLELGCCLRKKIHRHYYCVREQLSGILFGSLS